VVHPIAKIPGNAGRRARDVSRSKSPPVDTRRVCRISGNVVPLTFPRLQSGLTAGFPVLHDPQHVFNRPEGVSDACDSYA
jgi:hypothetical protein